MSTPRTDANGTTPDAGATVLDPPAQPSELPTVVDRPGLDRDDRHEPHTPASAAPARPTPLPTPAPTTVVTAADALRDEEVHRTRLFIRIGWLASLAGLGTIPFVDGERTVTVLFAAALILGMVVSFGFHQAFRDPRKFGPRALFVLGVMSTINTHVAILFFGAFTLAPVLIVIGLHFIGRSELSAGRAVYVTAVMCHGAIAVVLIAFGLPDPGVFATTRPLGVSAYAIAACYVQAAYALAYGTGLAQRKVSLRSIEQLQRATRVASQRAALLDELRVDLERARVVGSGGHSGEVVGGYRLGSVLGRGAYGEVYDAVAVADERPAAVKLLHRDRLGEPTAVARFLREVQATAALDSPHIVRVLATSPPDAAWPFLAMERLAGITLADKLRRTPVLPPSEVGALVADVGAAIDAARVAGVVHRDLKPQNLMATEDGWKVLDFGVAALANHGGTLTAGDIVGTPQYMAPEQVRGGAVDYRADLHALGVIAYRALTGRNPFGGADTPAILYAVIHVIPERPGAFVDLPGDVDAWTVIALAKDPAARWDSGGELARQFAAALRGELPATARAAAAALLAATPWRSAP